jgi:hypothetical protein
MWMADLIGGVVVLLFGLSVVIFSLQLPYMSEFGPGPGFLPLWLGIGIAGCAVAVILKVLKKRDRVEAFIKPQTRVGLQMLGLIVCAFLLLPLLGFSVGLALFAATAMRLIGKHGMLACGLTAVGAAIGINVIFGLWLEIPIPTGIVGW